MVFLNKLVFLIFICGLATLTGCSGDAATDPVLGIIYLIIIAIAYHLWPDETFSHFENQLPPAARLAEERRKQWTSGQWDNYSNHLSDGQKRLLMGATGRKQLRADHQGDRLVIWEPHPTKMGKLVQVRLTDAGRNSNLAFSTTLPKPSVRAKPNSPKHSAQSKHVFNDTASVIEARSSTSQDSKEFAMWRTILFRACPQYNELNEEELFRDYYLKGINPRTGT
jgi:hypothetical protein